MAIIDDFQTRFPSLATTIEGNTHILDVWSSYDGRTYSSTIQEAILNLIAHLLIVETEGGHGAAKDIQSQTIGRVSTSYAANAAVTVGSEFYKSTQYGQRYWLLLQTGGRCAVV